MIIPLVNLEDSTRRTFDGLFSVVKGNGQGTWRRGNVSRESAINRGGEAFSSLYAIETTDYSGRAFLVRYRGLTKARPRSVLLNSSTSRASAALASFQLATPNLRYGLLRVLVCGLN